MLIKKSLSDLSCEYSNMIYEKFLEKVYGLNACSPEYFYDHKEDYVLQIAFLKSGLKTIKDLNALDVDLNFLGKIQGAGKFFNLYNNTYITNNYTSSNISATGYTHTQTIAATVWTITNPLEYCPNVTIVDGNNQRISGQVVYSGACATITITFNSPVSGKAYLS
jgi:hypothetical protein